MAKISTKNNNEFYNIYLKVKKCESRINNVILPTKIEEEYNNLIIKIDSEQKKKQKNYMKQLL